MLTPVVCRSKSIMGDLKEELIFPRVSAHFPTRWQGAARRSDPLCGAGCRRGGRLPGDPGVQGAAGRRLHPDRLPGRAAQQRTQVRSRQRAEQVDRLIRWFWIRMGFHLLM